MTQFTLNDILRMTDQSTFARGNGYFKQGRAIITGTDHEQGVVEAEVQGSRKNLYDVLLYTSSLGLEAECSCPVNYNCKHGVAAALQWLLQRQRGQNHATAPTSLPTRQSSLQSWLDSMPAATSTAKAPTPTKQQMLYRLTVKNRQAQVEPLKGYLKLNGEWSQLKYFSPDFFNLRYNRPNHINHDDMTIMQMLQGQFSSGVFHLQGEIGALALSHLLNTGRLINADTGQTLHTGKSRQIQWLWQEQGTHQQLQASLEGLPNWQPLNITPPHYLDAENSTIGDIITPLSGPQFVHLLSMPPIPATEMDKVALQLRLILDATQLPLPCEPELTPANTPIPCLTLLTTRTDNGLVLPGVTLHFDYAGVPVQPGYGHYISAEAAIHSFGDKHYLLQRDPTAEEGYVNHLHNLGLLLFKDMTEHPNVWMPNAETPAEMLLYWQQFQAEQLPALQVQGWRIDGLGSIDIPVRNAAFTIQLQDKRNNWFDFGLELRLGNQLFDTMDIVEIWLDANTPDELILPGEDEWLRIDTKPLQSLRSLIIDLYNQKKLGKPVSLPAFQAGQFNDLNLDDRRAPLTRKLMNDLQHFAGLEPVPVSPHVQAELRPYQHQGLNWLVFLQRYGFGGVLADDMGLGKTLQTLALLQHMKDHRQLKKPALVIAPTSLMGNWVREACQFTPNLRVTLIHGPNRQPAFASIKSSDLVITSYPLLLRDATHYKKTSFSLMILDEAQAIKNPATKIAQQVRELKAGSRLCLSGTPLENHLGELWSLMDFALPGLLSGQKSFNQQYRKPIEEAGDRERQQELGRRLAPFMLRRTKTDVMAELPPKTEITQYVELEGKQRELYESIRVSMEKRIRDLIKEKGLARSHIEFLDALLKLRQACIDPRLVKLDKAAAIKEHAKLDWLAENIPQMLEEGRNILIFSQFTAALGLIESLLNASKIAYSKLTGQTRRRQQAIDSFQNGDTRVFLISLKAGGSGLNLTAADVVIHIDPWWNPAVENQATDRAHRMGQDKPVFVYKLVAADTVEERIQLMQQQKQALADALFSDTDAAGMPVDGDALLSLLSA